MASAKASPTVSEVSAILLNTDLSGAVKSLLQLLKEQNCGEKPFKRLTFGQSECMLIMALQRVEQYFGATRVNEDEKGAQLVLLIFCKLSQQPAMDANAYNFTTCLPILLSIKQDKQIRYCQRELRRSYNPEVDGQQMELIWKAWDWSIQRHCLAMLLQFSFASNAKISEFPAHVFFTSRHVRQMCVYWFHVQTRMKRSRSSAGDWVLEDATVDDEQLTLNLVLRVLSSSRVNLASPTTLSTAEIDWLRTLREYTLSEGESEELLSWCCQSTINLGVANKPNWRQVNCIKETLESVVDGDLVQLYQESHLTIVESSKVVRESNENGHRPAGQPEQPQGQCCEKEACRARQSALSSALICLERVDREVSHYACIATLANSYLRNMARVADYCKMKRHQRVDVEVFSTSAACTPSSSPNTYGTEVLRRFAQMRVFMALLSQVYLHDLQCLVWLSGCKREVLPQKSHVFKQITSWPVAAKFLQLSQEAHEIMQDRYGKLKEYDNDLCSIEYLIQNLACSPTNFTREYLYSECGGTLRAQLINKLSVPLDSSTKQAVSDPSKANVEHGLCFELSTNCITNQVHLLISTGKPIPTTKAQIESFRGTNISLANLLTQTIIVEHSAMFISTLSQTCTGDKERVTCDCLREIEVNLCTKSTQTAVDLHSLQGEAHAIPNAEPWVHLLQPLPSIKRLLTLYSLQHIFYNVLLPLLIRAKRQMQALQEPSKSRSKNNAKSTVIVPHVFLTTEFLREPSNAFAAHFLKALVDYTDANLLNRSVAYHTGMVDIYSVLQWFATWALERVSSSLHLDAFDPLSSSFIDLINRFVLHQDTSVSPQSIVSTAESQLLQATQELQHQVQQAIRAYKMSTSPTTPLTTTSAKRSSSESVHSTARITPQTIEQTSTFSAADWFESVSPMTWLDCYQELNRIDRDALCHHLDASTIS